MVYEVQDRSVHPFLFSFVSNGAGNYSNKSLPEKHVEKYPELRTTCYKYLVGSKIINPKSPTALWALQLTHLAMKDLPKARLCFMENFCTRHQLGEVIKIMMDGKIKITGTQRLNFIDNTNIANAKKAVSMVKKLERGLWALVKACNPNPKLEKLRKERNKLKKSPKKEKTTFVPPLTNPAENAGYVVFKDRKLVVFYSNDLATIPSKDILLRKNEEAIKAVNGLVKLHQ